MVGECNFFLLSRVITKKHLQHSPKKLVVYMYVRCHLTFDIIQKLHSEELYYTFMFENLIQY